jgi:MarR family transcriptional regulator, organic hydroperoxide resistance regulator
VCRWLGWRLCRWWLPLSGVRDIARALSITVGGASKVVDKVEAAGLCRRNPNPTDGRSNLIQLTEPGVGLLAAADVTFSAALATFVGAAAPADELTQMSSTLRRLRQHLLTPVSVQMAARR